MKFKSTLKRSRIGVLSVFLLAILSLPYACVKDLGKLPAPGTILCDTITYEKHIKPIIDASCVSCHGDTSPPGGFPLTSYEQLRAKAEAGKIESRVIRGDAPGFMPQGTGPLPQAQLDLISCWLQNGYKP